MPIWLNAMHEINGKIKQRALLAKLLVNWLIEIELNALLLKFGNGEMTRMPCENSQLAKEVN